MNQGARSLRNACYGICREVVFRIWKFEDKTAAASKQRDFFFIRDCLLSNQLVAQRNKNKRVMLSCHMQAADEAASGVALSYLLLAGVVIQME